MHFERANDIGGHEQKFGSRQITRHAVQLFLEWSPELAKEPMSRFLSLDRLVQP